LGCAAMVVAVSLCALSCASTSPGPAFHDTAQLITSRTGLRVAWNQGGADDLAIAKTLRALLARELTVDGAVQVALLNNKTLLATYEDISVAQADLVQAGLLQNPVFGAAIVFPVAGSAQTGGSVSVSQDFLGVFTLAARKRVAAAELEAAKLRVADAVLRTAFDVETAFFILQSAQQVAAMRRTILEAGDAALDLARRQREAGNINDLDLANQETLYEQVRTDLVRSDADVVIAREVLARLMGVWGPDAAYHVAEKLPELPAAEVSAEHLEAVAIRGRFDLGAAYAEAQAASHALAMAKNYRFFGTTSLGGSFERSPEGFSVAGPNASLELPLFDQKQAVIARLEARMRAALARETALAVDIRSEVRSAGGRLLAARAVVDRYAKVVIPLRQRVVELSQQQYNAMLLGAYQLLQVKQNEVNAYREFIEALRDYWTARAELERTTGGALSVRANSPGSESTRVQP
jgi:cobalt-zinc-cadmium efflux system outer membrane protein